jgi:hypothetical protein
MAMSRLRRERGASGARTPAAGGRRGRHLAALLIVGLAAGARAADDGTQRASPFRVNYLGYFQHGPKIALGLPRRAVRWPGR